MEVVPMMKTNPSAPCETKTQGSGPADWTGIVAAGALIAGGLLLLAGKRRIGTVVATSGAALALLEEQEAIRQLWEHLPGYIDEAQHLADRVQGTVEDLAVKRANLRSILAR